MNNEIEITPVPEVIADTRRLCEIRFDCMVKMHDGIVKRNNTHNPNGLEQIML
jgi:hypothetical protein